MPTPTPTALNETGAVILADLAQHTGSDTIYKHSFTRFTYTSGVQSLAQEAGAYWLIDLIMSHQSSRAARAEDFQVWTLYVRDGDKALSYPVAEGKMKRLDRSFAAVAVMTDGNTSEPKITQRIPYTDFSISGLPLWFENGTLMLPSER